MLQEILKLILFIIFKLIPKNDKVLVFGDRAGIRYADNSRYLFVYLNKHYKNLKCIWISNDNNIINYLKEKKYISYHAKSLKGIFYCLIAKYHIFNFVEKDINKIISTYSNSILLWHGVLPKKLNNIKISTKPITKFINNNLNKYFIYTNELLSKNIYDRFPKGKYKLIISNLPRNIIFSSKNKIKNNLYRTDDEIKLINKIKSENKTIFGYFPTWRKDGIELFRDVKNLEKLKHIDEVLNKNNSLILLKQHMNSDKKDKNVLYNVEIENITKYLEKLKNFRFIPYDFDLNSTLDICDILISDYSGVIFDYLFLDRPIICYAPDYEEFKSQNGFNLDPIEKQIAYYAKDLKELCELIGKYNYDKSLFNKEHSAQRDKIKNFVFPNDTNIERIIDLIV